MKNSEIKNSKIAKKELNHVFWRSFRMGFSWSYERQMNMAYVYAMIPTLKELYQSKEETATTLKRHLESLNTTPYIATLILGITATMKEGNRGGPEFDVTVTDNVKISLMGPLAGLGGSFFWGTLRLITAGMDTSLAIREDILGPILFILIFNTPHILFRYLATDWGYRLGTGFLKKVQADGMTESLTLSAFITGLMVVGAMTATMITINIPLKIDPGEDAVTVQSISGDIAPSILCPEAFGIAFYLLKKEMRPLTILIGLTFSGISGSWIGTF